MYMYLYYLGCGFVISSIFYAGRIYERTVIEIRMRKSLRKSLSRSTGWG